MTGCLSRMIPRIDIHGNCSIDTTFAAVAKYGGLGIFRSERRGQLPRRRRAVGAAKAVSGGFRRRSNRKSLIMRGLKNMGMEKARKNGGIATDFLQLRPRKRQNRMITGIYRRYFEWIFEFPKEDIAAHEAYRTENDLFKNNSKIVTVLFGGS